ncbi:hypothetical protein E1I69_21760 [Bacillus timonensis]|uniref:Uncharacterized protein n=1 Tax=Bacillus timonensis TaxID=1033734 RepID=A0A4S3PJP9_9BACI|nr:hypothetical protein [Bacillus timonensis]THE09599.1 hypothetical protein E1I69_21760 [Bacillus timonensis]
MSELQAIVEDHLSKIEEDYQQVAELAKKSAVLQQQQVKELEETSITLLPVMRFIKDNGFRFIDNQNGTYNNLGPVLNYNPETNSQFIFIVDQSTPAVLDLTSQQMTIISYEQLLQRVNYKTVITNLLRTLTYHQELKKIFEANIEKLENELKEFKGMEENNQP